MTVHFGHLDPTIHGKGERGRRGEGEKRSEEVSN
jgi:hypothetical protein